MFTKLSSTAHPPESRPLMAWDGECGFCHYWVIRWKILTGEKIEYQAFQEAAGRFPDVEYRYFAQAIRLIDTDGRIYTGPGAVFRALQLSGKYRWVMTLYTRIGLFRFLADRFYAFVSKNRTRMYGITIRLWGKNPARRKPYWLYYLGAAAMVVVAISLLI